MKTTFYRNFNVHSLGDGLMCYNFVVTKAIAEVLEHNNIAKK